MPRLSLATHHKFSLPNSGHGAASARTTTPAAVASTPGGNAASKRGQVMVEAARSHNVKQKQVEEEKRIEDAEHKRKAAEDQTRKEKEEETRRQEPWIASSQE